MSRSYLRDRFMRKRIDGHSFFYAKKNNPVKNRHRQDEMPKNHPSAYVTRHCSANVGWCQEPSSFGGHKIRRDGHRMVSGMVRASVKRETRHIIDEGIGDR